MVAGAAYRCHERYQGRVRHDRSRGCRLVSWSHARWGDPPRDPTSPLSDPGGMGRPADGLLWAPLRAPGLRPCPAALRGHRRTHPFDHEGGAARGPRRFRASDGEAVFSYNDHRDDRQADEHVLLGTRDADLYSAWRYLPPPHQPHRLQRHRADQHQFSRHAGEHLLRRGLRAYRGAGTAGRAGGAGAHAGLAGGRSAT
jgi:hypothetical protein